MHQFGEKQNFQQSVEVANLFCHRSQRHTSFMAPVA